ncbi:hypothetical protein BVG19_g2676 [[Candida] boidinii]|nr:hypothetical protein BVG19_g2676 [[Candida] boidinii]OWB51837.1 transferase activity, transferring glycosyl groups protein [[Candida] boidinii]
MASFRFKGRKTKILIPVLLIAIFSLSWVFSELYRKYIILAPHESIEIPESLTPDYSEPEDDGSESNELSTGVLGDFIHGDEQDDNYENYKVLSTYDQRSLFIDNNNGAVYERENAVFFTFISQVSDYFGLLKSIRTVEDRFNRKYKYDWVFAYANKDGIPEKLQGFIRRMVSGETFFVKVPTAEDSPNDCTYCYPNSFSKSEIEELKQEIKSSNLGPYSKFEKYRLKMRFQSFGFQNLEIMKNYRYYCNVDIEMDLSCDIDFDFFKFMSKNNKIFGFANASPEPKSSFSSFFNVISEYKEKVSLKDTTKSGKPPTLYSFLLNNNGKDYSKCTFNSDFEIFDLEFLRSKEYEELFKFVDSKNGFFHERWTASMIHTLAVSLLLDENDIFFFYSTGITDGEYRTVCPISKNIRLKNKCTCQIDEDYTWSRYSCIRKYFDSLNLQLPDNVPGVDLKNFPIKYKSMRFSHKNEEKKSSLKINYLDDNDPLLHKLAKVNKIF